MIVLKFGGTSVNTKERISTICEIVKKEKSRKPVVVVSAVRGITDLLLSILSLQNTDQKKVLDQIETIHVELAKDVFGVIPEDFSHMLAKAKKDLTALLFLKKKTKALQDSVVSYGENLSSHLIAHALNQEHIPSVAVHAASCIVTNDSFTAADFLAKKTKEKTESILLPLLDQGITPVVTGFIGATKDGLITTLGRGGSDYSASILGFSLQAEEIQFWKDVDGIYSADPKLIKNARLLQNLSYNQASRLIQLGAKVLHPRTIIPISSAQIPIRVMNTLHPEHEGTSIGEKE